MSVVPAAGPDLSVVPGPMLLSGVGESPALRTHRQRWASPRAMSSEALIDALEAVGLTGRGGAAFPFARKLATAVRSGRRREVVVNAAESEPASAKDSALMTSVPHLVLDGAALVARVLGAERVHVVVSDDRPMVAAAVARAVGERSSRRGTGWVLHRAGGGFVGGQSRAVVELLSGRANRPVSASAPEAVTGVGGLPTLLSNAETFAHVAAVAALGVTGYGRWGTPERPGTRLLSVGADGPGGVVLEVPFGTGYGAILQYCGHPGDAALLVGGYHGSWLTSNSTLGLRRGEEDRAGARLGAGVVLPLEPGDCPVSFTAEIVDYLARQSARRCGPCRNGLPAMAVAARALGLLDGGGPAGPRPTDRLRELCGLVAGRGACAHPDGTAGLVRSMLTTFPGEVAAHENGVCTQ